MSTCTRCANHSEARPAALVDANPARAHLHALMDAGHTLSSLAAATGLARGIVTGVLYRPNSARPPRQRIRAATARRVLAVPIPTTPPTPTARVCGVGTRRRVQALAALGHPITWQARQIGVGPQGLHAFAHAQGRTTRGTADAVRDLYDRYWGVVPEPSPAVTRAQELARRRGWVPPLAWDDDTIDDPAAVPQVGEETPRPQALAEDVHWLLDCGETKDTIARRLKISHSYLKKILAQQREVAA